MFNLRSIKFHGVALFDYFMTILCSFVVTEYTHVPLTVVTVCLFLLSVPLHFLFKIKTASNTYLSDLFI